MNFKGFSKLKKIRSNDLFFKNKVLSIILTLLLIVLFVPLNEAFASYRSSGNYKANSLSLKCFLQDQIPHFCNKNSPALGWEFFTLSLTNSLNDNYHD
jgi:hypothetical protein